MAIRYASRRLVPSQKKVSDSQPQPNFTGLWTVRRSCGARIETEYVNGVPNGVYRYWHEHGCCLRDGYKKDRLWHGRLITRSADGTVLDESVFDEGTGVYRIFNSNHNMTDEIPLLSGKPHGLVRCWRSGKLVTTYYNNGQRISAIG
jgi:antitoxin component YwqK of YwqJK toxin-antitoxin module